MYPAEELIRLARYKAVLSRRITRHRAQCVDAAATAAQPLAWLDRMLAVWRKLSPFAKFAAVPLGFLAKRTLFPRRKVLGSLVRWAPLIFSTVRSVFNSRSKTAKS